MAMGNCGCSHNCTCRGWPWCGAATEKIHNEQHFDHKCGHRWSGDKRYLMNGEPLSRICLDCCCVQTHHFQRLLMEVPR